MAGSHDQGVRPEQPERVSDVAAPADAGRGISAADARRQQALESLPAGHPSSPYTSDGRRRDPEPSLRSMELPLPAKLDGEKPSPAGPDGRRAPDSPETAYWNEVPRFKQMWADHLERWPHAPATTVDRSKDPPGSWRSDSNLYLSPEANARADEAISRIRDAEPRVSDDFQATVLECQSSAEPVGFKFRVKGEDRLKEKVAEALLRRPDTDPEEAIRDINDALRYTVCLEQEDYVNGCQDFCERFETRGYEMYYRKNHWEDAEYKGVNTRWMSPGGQRFEVQFHTAESYHAKQELTHNSYERIRNPLTTDGERAKLKTFQREVSSWLSIPTGATDIQDYLEKAS